MGMDAQLPAGTGLRDAVDPATTSRPPSLPAACPAANPPIDGAACGCAAPRGDPTTRRAAPDTGVCPGCAAPAAAAPGCCGAAPRGPRPPVPAAPPAGPADHPDCGRSVPADSDNPPSSR